MKLTTMVFAALLVAGCVDPSYPTVRGNYNTGMDPMMQAGLQMLQMSQGRPAYSVPVQRTVRCYPYGGSVYCK